MTPFSNLKDLQIKKAELLLKRETLKNTISKNWHSFKESLQPKNIIAQIINKFRNK